MPHLENLLPLVEKLPPITLDEMKSIRLMRRTDTKFVTKINKLIELLKMADGHYYAQRVNDVALSPYATTYFDDRKRSMFQTHQRNARPRMKVRVRTYLNGGVSFLEVKKKDNHGRTHKKRIKVESLENVLKHREGEDFLEKHTGLTFDDLQPTVSNRFHRITLVNFEKTERLTIDFDLRFLNNDTGGEEEFDNAVIIELKRDGRVPSPILPLLRTLRIHPSGFSKYCIGAVMTESATRVNRFKKKLRRVRKTVEGIA